jgi:GT2 family glycosyltransferase
LVPVAETKAKAGTSSARKNTLRRVANVAPELAIVVRDAGRSGTANGKSVELAQVLGGDRKRAVQLTFASGRKLKVPRERWEEVRGDLKTLVRDELAPLDASAREEILDSISAATELDGEASHELSSSLHSIREVLRERLPRCILSEENPVGLAVDEILAIDEHTFWVKGWMHDEDGRGAVTVVSPEGVRVPLAELAYRYERPDVVQFYADLGLGRTRDHGFVACVELPGPSLLADGWLAELETSDGGQMEVACPGVNRDPQAVRRSILAELGAQTSLGGELTVDHGRPALTKLQLGTVAASRIESVDEYGESPAEPAVSIVVPLYKRLDFLEHQLLHFSADPDFASAELVYVLDSVEQRGELVAQARALFALYELPFKVVNLSAGAGFAGANGYGIGVSRAPRLLLLNSDVIPDRPGWLGAMSEFYDATPGIGALGPKLLYEDDSLQHAGLYFYRAPGAEVWENAHCFKGLHRSFPAANVARPVPAVTAACMLIDRERYEAAGGLPLHYVQGDYEDSELCLRLAANGRSSWYLPAVELYHLEGQSYVPGLRRVPSEYNMWLHSSLWGERIEALMADFDPHSGAPLKTGAIED